MKRTNRIIAGAIAALLTTPALASEAINRDLLCAGMQTEVTLANGTRVDCISDTHAIEVDWSAKWAESIGQALSYAASTGKTPGVFLICKSRKSTCEGHFARMKDAIESWQLPIDVWMVPDQS